MKEIFTASLVMPTVFVGRGVVVPPLLPSACGLLLVGLVQPTANTSARTVAHPTTRRTESPPGWRGEGHLATHHDVYAIYELQLRREGNVWNRSRSGGSVRRSTGPAEGTTRSTVLHSTRPPNRACWIDR